MKKILSYVGIAAIGYFLLTRVFNSVVSKLSVTDVKLRFGPVDPSGVQIIVPLTIFNGSPISIPIKSFRGTLIYASKTIAPILINSPFTIEAGQSTTFDIESKINFGTIATDILNLIRYGTALENLRIIGSLNYEGVSIPIDQAINQS